MDTCTKIRLRLIIERMALEELANSLRNGRFLVDTVLQRFRVWAEEAMARGHGIWSAGRTW